MEEGNTLSVAKLWLVCVCVCVCVVCTCTVSKTHTTRTHTTQEYARHPTFESCVRLLVEKFDLYFHHAIKDLTHAFPKHARSIDKVP